MKLGRQIDKCNLQTRFALNGFLYAALKRLDNRKDCISVDFLSQEQNQQKTYISQPKKYFSSFSCFYANTITFAFFYIN